MLEKLAEAQLILENGMSFCGRAFGHLRESVGEVVCYSGYACYQEVLTDPAFAGKIVVMTYPLVGNFGINLDDFESNKLQPSGIVVREVCNMPNNFRCEMTLDGYMKQNRTMGLEGIDTRALSQVVRQGRMNGMLTTRAKDLTQNQLKQKWETCKHMPKQTGCNNAYTIGNAQAKTNVAVLDLGVTNSCLKELTNRFCQVTVLPHNSSLSDILETKPQALLVSMGAGNPNDLLSTVLLLKELVGKMPLFGIGLGSDLLAMALGCEISPLLSGHHGASYPVVRLSDKRVFITSQNHQNVVSKWAPNVSPIFLNANDNTPEGFAHNSLPVFGVSFVPSTTIIETGTGFCYDNWLSTIIAKG